MISSFLKEPAGLALATLLAAGGFAAAPVQAASFPSPDDILVCAKLFFEDHARFRLQCGSDLPAAPPSAPKSLSEPVSACPEDVPVVPSGGPSGGYVSVSAYKCGIITVTSFDGLPVYRFKYRGTDTWFYGLMIEDVLRDGRYASAVTTYADGVQTLDYEAIGLVVPDAEAMRLAGWKAVQIHARQS